MRRMLQPPFLAADHQARFWRPGVLADLLAAGRPARAQARLASMLGAGLVQLIGADVLRPALPWLLAAVAPVRIAGEMGQVRDPEGIGLLRALRAACVVSDATLPARGRADCGDHGGQGRVRPGHHAWRLQGAAGALRRIAVHI